MIDLVPFWGISFWSSASETTEKTSSFIATIQAIKEAKPNSKKTHLLPFWGIWFWSSYSETSTVATTGGVASATSVLSTTGVCKNSSDLKKKSLKAKPIKRIATASLISKWWWVLRDQQLHSFQFSFILCFSHTVFYFFNSHLDTF